MTDLKSIVVAVDFSPPSAGALRQGIRLANRTGAAVRAVHVIDTLVVMDLEAVLDSFQRQIREGLLRDARAAWAKFVADIPEAASVELDVRIDNRVAAILRCLRECDADLLVMGNHEPDEPDRGTGPLATACVRKAPCAVLLVRDRQGAKPFKAVVACVDFSDTSRR